MMDTWQPTNTSAKTVTPIRKSAQCMKISRYMRVQNVRSHLFVSTTPPPSSLRDAGFTKLADSVSLKIQRQRDKNG